jgi:mannose-6-phosphate isomerase-like protein (cupin superfamily)
MERFSIEDLRRAREQSGKLYHEFIDVPSMSLGVYELAADARDPQEPHTEDEVYYVVRGRGHLRVGDEETPVEPGSIVFVAAGVEHRFHDIAEDMTILVFFAPAEYSRRVSKP